MSEPLTFQAQLAPVQSGMMLGPDCLQVKFVPVSVSSELIASLFELQEKAFKVRIIDRMGDFSFNASIPDTASAIRPNKKTPQVQMIIPKSDVLVGLRLVALYGVVFGVEITDGSAKAGKAKKAAEKPAKGPWTSYWHTMFKYQQFQNDPSLWEALKVSGPAKVREELHAAFKVKSMSEVSPSAFEAWCEERALSNIVTQSRNAAAEVQA